MSQSLSLSSCARTRSRGTSKCNVNLRRSWKILYLCRCQPTALCFWKLPTEPLQSRQTGEPECQLIDTYEKRTYHCNSPKFWEVLRQAGLFRTLSQVSMCGCSPTGIVLQCDGVTKKKAKQRNLSRAYTSEPDAHAVAASLMEANH